MEQLNPAMVRIASAGGQVFGAGFLVGERRVLTCAHVVSSALGRQETDASRPTDPVQVDFPFLAKGDWRAARVDFWRPVGSKAEDDQECAEDVCVLELEKDPPTGGRPALLVPAGEVWDHTFRVLGFPVGRDNGVFATGKLRDQTADGWLQGEATENFGFSVSQGFSGAPVWDADLPGLIGMVVAVETGADLRVAYILPAAHLLAACPELQSGLMPAEPYKGLAPFDESDQHIFFGRGQATRDLREAVRDHPLVVLAGASGAGKSSLVFAGLVPELTGEGDWLTLRMHPGKSPLTALAGAFAETLLGDGSSGDLPAITESMLGDLKGKGTLRGAAELVARRPVKRGHVLLIVDQFEEIFTECLDPEERSRFIELLAEAARSTNHARPELRIVLTVRTEFLNPATLNGRLTALLNQATMFLGPMSGSELRAAIEGPAALKGVTFEGGLTDLILDEVGSDQANLPLLEYALSLLWECRKGSKLSVEAYKEIGGVRSALARRAQAVYEALDDENKRRAERIFVQLVLPGDGTPDTRRTATQAEIGEENWELVTRLADERLLVCDRDTVMLVHEALIGSWSQLGEWIKANREFRTWQEELRTAMHLWERNARDDGWLLRETPLNTALTYLDSRKDDLTEAERAFIGTSAEADAEARRKSEDYQLEMEAAVDGIRKQVLADDVDPPIFLQWKRAAAVWIGISVLVFLAYLAQPFLRSAELAAYDLLFQLRGSHAPRPDIVVVQMDTGFNAAASADDMAGAIAFLRKAGAAAIGLDIPYTEANTGRTYRKLASAIRSAGNVVVAAQLTDQFADNNLSGVTWALHPPAALVYRGQCGLQLPTWDLGTSVRGVDLMETGPAVEWVCGKPGFLPGREFPAMAVELVAVARHESPARVVAGLDRHNMLIDYTGPAGGDQKPFVLRQFSSLTSEDPSHFKGAVVLIVPPEDGHDSVQTPYGQMFEPYVQANIVDTILGAGPIVPGGQMVNAVLLLALTLLTTLLAARLSIGRGAIGATIVILAWVAVSALIFGHFRIWLNLVTPVASMVLALSVCLILRFADEEHQGRRRRYLTRVFSALGLRRVSGAFGRGSESTSQAGARRPVTLLSVHVPGLTAMSKASSPEEVMRCLDIVQSALTTSVETHRGTVDQYLGDGLTAVWNAPHYQKDHPMLAVLAAMDMIAHMEDVNGQLNEAGLPPVQYGVGISTDRAVVGLVRTGSNQRLGIVGEVVGVAGQLSRAAHGGSVIIDETTWQLIGDRVVAPEVEPLIARESGQIYRTFQVISLTGAQPEIDTALPAEPLVTGRTT